MDDRELVRRILAGAEPAFDEFFERSFHRLFRFARRRVSDLDAVEDIVQSTLVTAVRKLHTWRGEAALFTWLCTLCRHQVSDHYRRTARGPVALPLDDDPHVREALEVLASTIEQPDAIVERHEVATLVQLTLDYLPGHYGDVLEWKYIVGLSVAEIATRMGVTEKSVEGTLTRARDAFREGFALLSRS